MVILVLLPALVFGVPALVGHPVLPGDDLTQNFPLRVLTGRQISAGHLPLFDPYIWSGAPLLSGWNAGAAYPFTLLFAILPGIPAWTLNLMTTWATAGLGMFWFLRALRLGTSACFLGALSFAFAGAMPAQVGHFGLVAGVSWVPVELLAVLRLTQARSRASSLRWVCVLALAFGLTILAGEPRAIADASVIVCIYAGWRIARGERGFGPAAVSIAVGLGLGICLGAVQWLPGLAAVTTSQRAATSMALFSSGSLPPRWLLLLVVPDLLGGSGSFGQPGFLATYNLAEVTSYVGILPLVAAALLLGRLRLRSRPPEWVVWHVIAVVGLVCALGGRTPVGHLLVHLPLFGDQRLQSRNIAVLDLALAVLFAYWADDPFAAKSRAGQPDSRRRVAVETGLGVIPPLITMAVAAVGIFWPADMLGWLGVASGTAGANGRIAGELMPYALLGAAAAGFVIFGRRLHPKIWSRLLAAFVATDIVVFTLLAVVAVGAGHAATATTGQVSARPTRAKPAAALRPIAALGYHGRYAIYDPGLLSRSELSVIGAPDLNVITATPSVQGYSSIVDGRYAAATGAHRSTGDGQDVLAPSAISNGTLAELDTSVLLTVSPYLVTVPGGNGPVRGPPGIGQRYIAAGQRAMWFLGDQFEVARIEVPDSAAARDAARGARIGLTTPGGPTRWFGVRAVGVSLLAMSPPTPVPAVAVVARAGGQPSRLGPPTIVTADGRTLVADGQLENALAPPRWRYAGSDGSFAVFVDHDARGLMSVTGLHGRSAAGASVRVMSVSAGIPTAVAVRSPNGVRIVRSVAAIPGWTATWHPRHGRPTALAIRRADVVQSVDIPAGNGVVTWSYSPPRLAIGLASTVGAAVIIVLALVAYRPRRKVASRDWPP